MVEEGEIVGGSFEAEEGAIDVQALRFDGTRAPYFASEESSWSPPSPAGPAEHQAACEGSSDSARKLRKTEVGDISAGQAIALQLPAAVRPPATYPRCVGQAIPDMDRETSVDVYDVRDMVLGLTCEAQLPSWSRVESSPCNPPSGDVAVIIVPGLTPTLFEHACALEGSISRLLPSAVAVGRVLQSEPDFSLSALTQMLSVPRAPEATELAVPNLEPPAPVPAGWEGPLPPSAYALTLEELLDNEYPLLEDAAEGELAIPPGYVLTRPWKELEEEARAEEAGKGGVAELTGAGEPAELAGAGEPAEVAGVGESAELAGVGEPAELAGVGEPAELAGVREPAEKTAEGIARDAQAVKAPAAEVLPQPSGTHPRPPFQHHHVVGLDCEMVQTAAGSELARVVVADAQGEQLLDLLVRPSGPVLDYRTRWSGMTAERLERATHDLEAARAEVQRLVSSATLLVAHSGENDLRALRLVHTRVLDTAVLFLGGRSRRSKLSLKSLAFEHLGAVIQQGSHEPLEDARAALALARLVVRQRGASAARAALRAAHDSLADALRERCGARVTAVGPRHFWREHSGGAASSIDCARDREAAARAAQQARQWGAGRQGRGGGAGRVWAGPTLAAGVPTPAQNQPAPAQNQPAPAQNQPAPAQNQPAPAQNQPAPAQNQPAPAQNQSAPAQNQPTSDQDQPTPSPPPVKPHVLLLYLHELYSLQRKQAQVRQRWDANATAPRIADAASSPQARCPGSPASLAGLGLHLRARSCAECGESASPEASSTAAGRVPCTPELSDDLREALRVLDAQVGAVMEQLPRGAALVLVSPVGNTSLAAWAQSGTDRRAVLGVAGAGDSQPDAGALDRRAVVRECMQGVCAALVVQGGAEASAPDASLASPAGENAGEGASSPGVPPRKRTRKDD